VLLGVLAWHGLRAEAEAHVAGAATDPVAIRRLTTVVERIEAGSGAAGPRVRSILDGYLNLCAAELNRIGDRHDPEPWARAAQIWDRVQQPYPLAYARLRQGEAALQRKAKRPAATAALREAYGIATTMGARPFAAEIVSIAHKFRVALADDADTVPMPAPGPEPDDELGVLTTREREVLAAVAEGLTNREIGERLFISERTVGVHVGHIFDKLQVRTRVQASRVYLTAA
jgi:DNA-binding CsgD family transcriptional regulator